MEKEMAPHSSTLAWKISRTEGPGWLQSMGLKEPDTTEQLHFHFSLSCIGEGNGNPLQCYCLDNWDGDGGAWWAAIYGVAQSQTRLKRLSSSSSITHSISSHPEEKSDLTDSWISKEKPDMWSPGHSSSCPLVRTLDLKELMIPWTSLFSKQSMVDSNWTGKTG